MRTVTTTPGAGVVAVAVVAVAAVADAVVVAVAVDAVDATATVQKSTTGLRTRGRQPAHQRRTKWAKSGSAQSSLMVAPTLVSVDRLSL